MGCVPQKWIYQANPPPAVQLPAAPLEGIDAYSCYQLPFNLLHKLLIAQLPLRSPLQPSQK